MGLHRHLELDLSLTENFQHVAGLARETTVEEVNAAIKEAADGRLNGILEYVVDDLVSIDFNHNPASSNFDSTQTQVIDGTFVRVLSWYDNEWGFSNRMPDTAVAMNNVG
ncbi:MAG: aldehyde dehydrogenase [Proteobacteria bacterium]|nr:aldehyde dehydrogenase [Pseudomonadota bacterium]